MNRLPMAGLFWCAASISIAQAPVALSPPPDTAAAAPLLVTGLPVQGGLVRGVAPPGATDLTLDGRRVPIAPDGSFILGFDRDQGPAAVLAARRADGASISLPLRIAARAWSIERINMPRPSGGPTEAFRRIRDVEVRRIEAARAVNALSDGWRQAFIAPARGRFSGRFGSQRVYRGEPAAYHSGLDIAAGAGAVVVAPADGVVALAGPPMFSLEGNLVILDHGMGLNSAFLHLSTVTVRQGETVRQGQQIGTVGSTGRATGPHLHWSVKWMDAKLDPLSLLDR